MTTIANKTKNTVTPPVCQEWYLVTPSLAGDWLRRPAFSPPFARTTQMLAQAAGQRYATVAFDRDGALLSGAAILKAIMRNKNQQVLLVFSERNQDEEKN